MKVPLQQYWTLLVTYLRPQRAKVSLLAVLLFSGIGLQLIIPQILRSFIDASRLGTPLQALTTSALIFMGVVVLKHMVNIIVTYLSEDVGWKATNALRADLTVHCLRLDMSFHNLHTPGELIERIDGDVQVLSNFFSQLVVIVIGNLLLLVGVLVMLFVEDWRVGLAFTLFAGLALLVQTRIRDLSSTEWKAAREASAGLYGFLEERLAGTIDTKANGGTAYTMARMYGALRANYRAGLRAWLKTATIRNIMIVLFVIGSALSLVFGAYLSTQGFITIGTVYLIYAYTSLLFLPLERITKELENLQSANASISRVQELYQTPVGIQDGAGAAIPAGPLDVQFQNVTFGYDPAVPVLHDLSFAIKPGTVVGLLGRTGSGKTTISRLLMRLYDPTGGRIRVNGVDLRDTRQSDLRQQVGLVTQDVNLFHATIRDNLTFFNRAIPDETILKVLRDLGLWTWYAALPHGLDTVLESRGGNLSAGEAQLLAFTRVFLNDPGLVILDEASSRLDPATERLIERALDRLLGERTVIIIAHRLATVQKVDSIMILEDGAIREYGEREQLAHDPASAFSRLLQTGLQEVLA
jgi:ATP-binding cassette subfamily B protein